MDVHLTPQACLEPMEDVEMGLVAPPVIPRGTMEAVVPHMGPLFFLSYLFKP